MFRCVLLFAAIGLTGCASSSSNFVYVDDDDPVMLAAIEEARATVGDFISVLKAKNPNQQGLSIKAFVGDESAGEHIWLSSVEYEGGAFSGQVDNLPEIVTSLSLGDKITVPRNEISDWMYIENGKLVGGYTIRALIEITPPAERPDLPFAIE